MKRRSAARIGVNSRDPDHRGDVGDNRLLITDQTQGLLSRGSQVRILPGVPFLSRTREFRRRIAEVTRSLFMKVGADIYIEDNPANIERLRGEGFHTICFGNSSNKSVAAPRAESWRDVYWLVHEHAECPVRLAVNCSCYCRSHSVPSCCASPPRPPRTWSKWAAGTSSPW